MTIEELEQLKANGMIDDRKYQQLKSAITMQGYQPGQRVAPSNAYEMTNYGKNLQAQAEPMEQNFNPYFGKIAKLEQQIAQVKERIARNTRTLYGKSYEDANKKLATLEMDKIGVRLNRQPAQSDPTMLWRWNQGRLDTLAENANVKSNEAAKFANTVDMWVNTRSAPTTEGIMQQISNISSAIRDGKNAGADVSRLIAKKAELENLVHGGKVGTEAEITEAEVDTIIKTAKSSKEIKSYRNKNQNLNPAQKARLEIKNDELQKQEAAKADASAKKKSRKSIFGD